MTVFVALAVVVPASNAKQVSRTCGLLPGDGAYSYVKTRGVKCRAAKKIAFKAQRRFCARHSDCLLQGRVANTRVYRGKVGYRGWACRVKYAWEDISVKCVKGTKWLFYATAS